MIAAAAHNPYSWYQSLSFNWFDVALVVVLGFGYWRGRKRGMSREALPVSMWVILVLAAGFGHQFLGQWLIQSGMAGKIFGSLAAGNTLVYLSCYLLIVMIVATIFSILGKHFREKISGSNTFGSGEYYLGMIAGTIRYACIIIFFLALLNAPFYSAGEIAANQAYKARWYGGGLSGYSGDYIPSLDEVQAAVFKSSFTGPYIKNNMACLLVNSTAPAKKTASAKH